MTIKRKAVWRAVICACCGRETYALEGDWIKARRNARGYSQRKFAKLLGISCAYVCQLENNQRNGTWEMHEKVIEVLK